MEKMLRKQFLFVAEFFCSHFRSFSHSFTKEILIMKAIFRFIVLFHFVFACACSPAFSQCIQNEGEVLGTCPPSPSPIVNNVNNRVHLTIADPSTQLQNPPNSRYKAFWILGDGNYRYFEHQLTPALDAPSRDIEYFYPESGIYNVVTLLSEKKSNTDPPPNPIRRVDVQNGGTQSSFTPRLSTGKPVDIFNSEWNRPKYPTGFVVSAPRGNPVLTGVYFFYNSKRDATGSYVPENFHVPVTGLETQYPKYFNNFQGGATPTQGLVSNLSGLPSWFFNKVNAEFQNYIFVPIAPSVKGNVPTNFSEIRFFPILNSNWNPAWAPASGDTILPTGHYLAVTVGAISLKALTNDDSGAIKYISADSADVILNNVTRYFGDSGDGNSFSLGQVGYIHGVDSRDVMMVLGIDPNGLQVLEICPEGRGRYKVKFRLEVCNKGYASESNFPFTLTDNTQTFSKPIFSDDKIKEEIGSSTTQWNFRWTKDVLEEIPLPESGVPHSTSEENCKDVEFTSTTTWAGVQSLVAGKALKVCVKFAHADEECHDNSEIIPASEVTQLDGYNCGSSCQRTACDLECLLYYILILQILLLILQLILLWLWWKKLKKAH